MKGWSGVPQVSLCDRACRAVLSLVLTVTTLPVDASEQVQGQEQEGRVVITSRSVEIDSLPALDVRNPQLVIPTQVQAPYGSCLFHVRSAFGASPGSPSATGAADNTRFRHTTRTMPNYYVPVWFDHWGVYQGVFGNWGHVVIWNPDKKLFESTPITYNNGLPGVEYFGTIGEIESIVGGSYRFWSEDINGVRVVDLGRN